MTTMSATLGERPMEFEHALGDELDALCEDGKFTEIVESNALIAFRG
jgi:hypothetical protein